MLKTCEKPIYFSYRFSKIISVNLWLKSQLAQLQGIVIFSHILEGLKQGPKATISEIGQNYPKFYTPIYYTCVRVTREGIFVSANSSQSYGRNA